MSPQSPFLKFLFLVSLSDAIAGWLIVRKMWQIGGNFAVLLSLVPLAVAIDSTLLVYSFMMANQPQPVTEMTNRHWVIFAGRLTKTVICWVAYALFTSNRFIRSHLAKAVEVDKAPSLG